MTFEEYIKHNFSRETPYPVIDHTIRCHVNEDRVSFYIHPFGVDGITLDFVVKGNRLEPIMNCKK